MKTYRDSLTEIFGEPIHSYSRAEAIADGALVDISEMASEAGFCVPVSITAAAWSKSVAWGEVDNARQTFQDESGRLWDVLVMAARAARRGGTERLSFQLYRVPRGGRGIRARLVELHLCIGPGDSTEPVVTIMLPDED